MFNDRPRIGQELLDVPMGDMIREMAFAIADAQIKLDSNSIEVAQMMGGLKTITSTIGGVEQVTFADSRVFFGKEKMTLAEAVDTLNATTDLRYIASIMNAAGTNIVKSDSNYALASGAASRSIIYVPSRLSMLELGFSPTFYQFVDTIIEVKISITYTQESESTTDTDTTSDTTSTSKRGSGVFGAFFGRRSRSNKTVSTTQVNAKYSQKYSYTAEGSSLLRTKLVPIPPPAILEERIRQQMEIASEQEVNE